MNVNFNTIFAILNKFIDKSEQANLKTLKT